MSFFARCRLPVLLVLWCGLVAAFLFSTPRFYGPDDYFHVATARHLLAHGLVLKQFPWVTESVWCERYFDKEYLFHVLLALVLPLGDPLGPKLLVVALNGLIVLSLWYLARRVLPVTPLGWLLLIPACSLGEFWLRMISCRPHLLALALLAFALGAMLRGRHGWLALCTFLYTWSHTGHWQLLGLAIAADAAGLCFQEDGVWRPRWTRRWPASLTVLLAMAAAELAHPNFPNILYGLYLQNVRVLLEYWQGSSEVLPARPLELRATPWPELLTNYGPLLAALVCVAAHWLRTRARPPRVVLIFGAYTLLYLVMTLKTRSFGQYLVPVGVLFVGAYAGHLQVFAGVRRAWVYGLAFATLAALVVLFCGGVFFIGLTPAFMHGVASLRQGLYLLPLAALLLAALSGVVAFARPPVLEAILGPLVAALLLFAAHSMMGLYGTGGHPPLAGAAAWVRQNLQPGEVVFTASWSDAPMLFYGAPDQHYLVFLDPYFMYARDPARYHRWNLVRAGADPAPASAIVQEFHSRVVVTRKPTPDTARLAALYAQLSADPTVRQVYTAPADDPNGPVIFLLRPDPLAATLTKGP